MGLTDFHPPLTNILTDRSEDQDSLFQKFFGCFVTTTRFDEGHAAIERRSLVELKTFSASDWA